MTDAMKPLGPNSGVVRDANRPDRANYGDETLEEERRRLVQEWTEKLSNIPGWRGRLLRTALSCQWC